MSRLLPLTRPSLLLSLTLPLVAGSAVAAPRSIRHLDDVQRVLGMTDTEVARVGKSGVLSPAEAREASFAAVYREVWVNDLPVFITADSMLHALHRSYDRALVEFEREAMRPWLDELLTGLDRGLELLAADARWSSEPALPDVRLVVSVTRAVLADCDEDETDCAVPTDRSLVELAVAAAGPATVELFGREREIDFSLLQPRGHYATAFDLHGYFRALQWLGQAELRLAEGAGPQVRRRQVAAALVMDEALLRGGVRKTLQRFERALTAWVGEADSTSLLDVEVLRTAGKLRTPADVARLDDAALRRLLGSAGLRPSRILGGLQVSWPDEPGQEALPIAVGLVGPRHTVDAEVLGRVVLDRIEHEGEKVMRMLPEPADVMFALGNERARRVLAPALARHPYEGALNDARAWVESLPKGTWTDSLYGIWLGAISTLGQPLPPRQPAVFRSDAFSDRLLAAQLASWAELRHDNVAYAKQSFTFAAGCSFPDVLIEPVPELFATLSLIGRRFDRLLDQLPQEHRNPLSKWARTWTEVMERLSNLARKQLIGEKPSAKDAAFLRSLVEVVHPEEPGYGGPGELLSGWYPALYLGAATDELREWDALVADVHTAPTDAAGQPTGSVLHVGTGRVRYLVVVVEGGSGPVAYVGPVYGYHELTTEGFERLTDVDWRERLSESGFAKATRPAWTRSYVAE